MRWNECSVLNIWYTKYAKNEQEKISLTSVYAWAQSYWEQCYCRRERDFTHHRQHWHELKLPRYRRQMTDGCGRRLMVIIDVVDAIDWTLLNDWVSLARWLARLPHTNPLNVAAAAAAVSTKMTSIIDVCSDQPASLVATFSRAFRKFYASKLPTVAADLLPPLITT